MMGEMIFRNLIHRPIRTIIGIVAIGVEVALVVLVVGLTSGILTETAKRVEGIGADIMLQSPSAQVFLAFSGSPMPIKIADRLKELKYVQSVSPVFLQFSSSGGIDLVYGIDRDSFRAVSGGFVFLSGKDMEGPDDLLVDDLAAQAKKIKVGDTFNLLNHDWHVAGIVEHGKGARLFVPLLTLQDLGGAHDKASVFLLKCTRPEHTEDVINQMQALLPNYKIHPLKDYLSLMTSTNVPGLNVFVNAMIALAVCIGLLVIFLTMYTTVIERTRDIGVLKSLGANSPFIVRAILTESAALCLAGIMAGVGLSYAVRAGFVKAFPTLSILITPEWILRAGIIAMIGAILGASYPAWMASRRDAVEALTFD
ncbi:MAG TPA: FtsX-like permease family protein [Candidatus Acidoferrum sp.]|nr:FtsX-like permease family protein [Candidatus Acidoferrum sp.]